MENTEQLEDVFEVREADEGGEPMQDGDGGETINARFLHRDIPLERKSIESLAASLGLDVDTALGTIQKGLNYDRLLDRQPPERNEQEEWVKFFVENPTLEPDKLPAGMLDEVAQGTPPALAYYRCELDRANRRVEELERLSDAAQRSPGSTVATMNGAADDFLSAFDSVFRI